MAKKKIARDDGHGLAPLTPGKRTPFIPEIGRFIPENEFNKAVCRLLGEELHQCGFDTMETAPGDVDHSLASRVKRANDAKADLFISIHYNAIDGKFDGNGKDPEGFSAHIDPSGGQSLKFAQIALKHLAKGTVQKNRGVVKQQLYVTANTKMPAVLFELGFMDNNREALLMIDKAFQRECAVEIAMAVCEFYGVPYKGSAKPEVTKPAATPVIKPPAATVKIGSLITKKDVHAYARPEWGTQTGAIVEKGQTRHVYAKKNGWYQLFSGEWLPAQSGDNFDYIPVKTPEPTTGKPKPKLKRVVVDGKQVGAFSADEGIVLSVSDALKKNAKKINVEEI